MRRSRGCDDLPTAAAGWAWARAVLVCAALVWTASAVGCSQDEEQVAVATALDQTINALEAGDMQALWDITAPKAQKELTTLHSELHEALALVDGVYPDDQQEDARKALGQALIGDIPVGDKSVGPKILERILDPKAVRLDEKARDGLRTRGATIDGDKAVIHTSADEKFTFEKTADGWRSALVMDLIDQNRRFDTLRENARKVLEARDALRQAWIASRNPKTPHGGYNVLRRALADKPIKTQLVFSLLDKPTRAVVLETLKTARQLQKAIQRRSKKARRRALYKKYGIYDYVKTDTDRGLWALYAKGEGFTPPLTDLDDKPDKIEGKQADGKVVVVTAKGKRVTMRRGDDGVWRIADYAAVLRDKLLKPVQDSIKELTNPEGAEQKSADGDKK